MEPNKVILYPLMGEKATLLREKSNVLTFIVDKKATKKDVKEAVETLYKITIQEINVMVTSEGLKKAHVRLSPKDSAEEVASHFGII
ncbi:50S ribosomal protein L23 [uncultured archaeon]|nr:50S ribosomal protein L23 [uncultured archaeon]